MKNQLPVSKLFLTLFAIFIFSKSATATTYDVTTYATLTAAIAASVDGDIINFKEHIVVSASISVAKALTFQGNGYTITVPVPGLNDVGVYNISPSAFNVFALSGAKTIVFNRLVIKGGSTSSSGAAVTIASTTIAKFNNCTISNSRCSTGGGGMFNQGTCYLYKTLLTRNVGDYGGGMLNSGGKVFIEYSTINENRTLTVNGGGGIETKLNAFLYVNNCCFSNNQSGAGGAINNFGSQTYICNTSFTGNIAFNSTPLRGGAIYQDQQGVSTNTLNLVNCLFAYNYYAPTGAYAASSYTIDDIRGVSGNIYLYYCTYMNNSASGGVFNYVIGNNLHLLAANGSDNDIFTGGSLATPFDGTGVIQGTGQVFQPLLVNVNGQRVPTLKTGSYALTKGCVAGFTNGSGTAVAGYMNMSTSVWTTLTGSAASTYAIGDDLTGFTRAVSPAVGALEKIVDNYIILKVNASTGGTVSGASIYGEAYPSGTSITLTALPATGYAINNWTYNLGGSGTISGNPITIAPTTNTTLTPNFVSSSSYTITYLGNGNTSGTVPAIGTYGSGVNATIATNTGLLAKTGFVFNGWNTSDFGAGTSYAASATYTANANMVLYASWISLGFTLNVELLNFTAFPNNSNNTVLIKWSTATENNNDYFEIERSPDCASNWESIGKVQGVGNASVPSTYSFADNNPLRGQYCYRLKQVDKDGQTRYLKIVKVQLNAVDVVSLSVFPTLAKDIVTIKGKLDQKSIRVFNQSGQDITVQCKPLMLTTNTFNITVAHLPLGGYIIYSNAGSAKFIKAAY